METFVYIVCDSEAVCDSVAILLLCVMKKAVAFLNVLKFGIVRIDFGNWFQSQVSEVVSLDVI